MNIKDEIASVFEKLTVLLNAIPEAGINTASGAEKWSAAQVVQHVILVCKGFNHLLHGPVEDSIEGGGELLEKLRRDMANEDERTVAPTAVEPRKEPYRKDKLLKDLSAVAAKLLSDADNLDLSKKCTLFSLPEYGYFTRLEALAFLAFHTDRHYHQLLRMLREQDQVRSRDSALRS